MSKYGYIGKDVPAQSIQTGNAGVFNPDDVIDLKQENKYGPTNEAYRLLSVTELSGSSTLIGDITGYGQYQIFVQGVTFSEDAILQLRFSEDNGATLKSGASDYDWRERELNDQGTLANINDTADSEIQLGTSSEATKPLDVHIELHHADTSETLPGVLFQTVKTDAAGTFIDHSFGMGFYNESNVVNGIGFVPSAGTFSGGRVSIYGVNLK
jgi:hypothetical protein